MKTTYREREGNIPATNVLVKVLNFWLPLVPGGETTGGLGNDGINMSVADLFTIQMYSYKLIE